MAKAKFSEADSRGMICVDCIECERGPKGSATDKCAAGARHKKGHQGSCFSGVLIKGLEVS